MPHDVFLSYASADKPVADAACAVLEQHGLRCWIAPRDATPGLEWSGEIIRAINECSVMVLIYSRNANTSQQVHREVERAVAKGIAIVPFRIENVPASETLEYFISTPHWLDALTPPLEQHLKYLADTVALLKNRLSGQPQSGQPQSVPPPLPAAPPSAGAWRPSGVTLSRARLTRLIGAAAVLGVAIVGWIVFSGGDSDSWTGTWVTDNRIQAIPAHWTLEIDGDYRYRSSVETRDVGTIGFSGSRYRMTSEYGPVADGAINIQSPTTAVISGPLGSATWQRDPQTATAGTRSAVGIWKMTAPIQQVTWTFSLAIMPNGRFELSSRSQDSGTFVAKDATWQLNSSLGLAQSGTFARIDDRTVTMTGPLGTATWRKQ
jgi:hypothetical protein